MSRNVTTTTDNISPIPRENNVAKQIGNTDKKIVHVIGVLVINITIINATNDVNIFTKDEHTHRGHCHIARLIKKVKC